MGTTPSSLKNAKSDVGEDGLTKGTRVRRNLGFTEGKTPATAAPRIPPGCDKTSEADYDFMIQALGKLLLFQDLDTATLTKILSATYERKVRAGDILIKQGDRGQSARELYIVKDGKFEVMEQRQGVMMRVNMKERGDCFGEISLMFDFPRSATVAATTDAVVWVLTRDMARTYLKEIQKTEDRESELFLNSVPILNSLSKEEKTRLVDALETETFEAGDVVIRQGDVGDRFYIIREGEGAVFMTDDKGRRKVNHLFKSDFFGEAALLSNEPRTATVEAITKLTCLTLNRETFVEILGPLQDLMAREKSDDNTVTRLELLQAKGAPSQTKAEVHIRRRRKLPSGEYDYDLIVTMGHLDEVAQLRKGGMKTGEESSETNRREPLVLTEGTLLGSGAFSRVSEVKEESTGRKYALKCMLKSAVAQCPEHVFCEQLVTRNLAHPFCVRQYASSQDNENLYFLFDLMTGGDLMDVLVAEAKVISRRMAQGTFRRACLAPKKKMLQGMNESLAKFYIASLVLALEYLHDNNIVYRDLKPENVFVDETGFIKLGDFGFAKMLEDTGRTYTFCGTPGYVAPENILAQGYNYSVDWWGLGVLTYVLLTGRQPFTNPRTDDPMIVMRRIVDENWPIAYPPYLSTAAKDLIGRLLERRPARRLGMLIGRASDIKRHRWFEGFDWDALESRKMEPPRKPNADSARRILELEMAETQPPSSANPSTATTSMDQKEIDATFAAF